MAQVVKENKVKATPYLLIAGKSFIDIGFYARSLDVVAQLGSYIKMAKQYANQVGQSQAVQIVDDQLYINLGLLIQIIGVLPSDKYNFITLQALLAVMGSDDIEVVTRANDRINPIRSFRVIQGGLS